MKKDTNNAILIYRDRILPPSETFILEQVKGLQNFYPYFLGSRLVEGLDIPYEKIIINNGGYLGRMQEIYFKLVGRSPNVEKKLRLINPKLIHAHFGFGGVLSLELAKLFGIPLLITFHGSDVTIKDHYLKKCPMCIISM